MTAPDAPEQQTMEIESPLRSGGSANSTPGAGRAEGRQPEGNDGGGDERGAAAATPAASDTPDLSHVHESLKERVKDWPKEALEALRSQYVPKAEYTRQRQQEKAEIKKLQALAQSGEKWQQMMSRPELVKHMLAFDEARSRQAEEEEPDWDAMTPKEIVKAMNERNERRLAAARDEWKRETVQTVTAPDREVRALNDAATAWRDENGVDEAAYDAAVAMLDKSTLRKHLSPENVGDYLAEAIERQKMQAEIERLKKGGQSGNSASGSGAARAASPRGASGGSAPNAQSLRQMIEAGKSPSDAAYELMLRKRGKSEREMDAEMGFTS
jgi:hypothetical protein